MAGINFSGTSLTSPVWAGDFLDRNRLVAGGAKVDATQWTADANNRKPIQSGTLIGRTYAERDAGTGFGPAEATDNEIYLVAFDVTDAMQNDDVELYRHNSLVKENKLPGWGALAVALQDKIRELYTTTLGVD